MFGSLNFYWGEDNDDENDDDVDFLFCNGGVHFCYHVTHFSDKTVTMLQYCILNAMNRISLQKILHESTIHEYSQSKPESA